MQHLERHEVHLWQSVLDASSERILRMRLLLNENELARAERFRTEQARRSFIVARGALRCLLGGYLGQSPQTISIESGAQGKPQVSGLQFSISHSFQIALLAFSKECEVGVDVEKVRSLPDRDQITERFFSPGEAAELKGIAAEERDLAFFNCWTRKEAYVKAVGRGLQVPLHEFRVTLAPHDEARILHLDHQPAAANEWQVYALQPAPDYVGAVVYRSHEPKPLSRFNFPEDFRS
jgi:4'-phosphopantetheinyl transferase